MQYIEIIQTQSATVVETIKVRVLVPNGMTQEEFRHHLDDEGIASEFTEVHEDDAYIQYDNDDPAIFQLTTQLVHGAQPGHQYTLSAAIRAQGLNATAFGGGATICAQWNAPPFYGDYLGGGPSGWTNWTAQSLTFVYPPSMPATVRIGACIKNGRGGRAFGDKSLLRGYQALL